MQKTITFEKGITRVPYSDAVGDGELETAHNVEVHGGSLRPATLKGSEIALLPDMVLLYKHETGEYEHWILKWKDDTFGTDTEGNAKTGLVWVDIDTTTGEIKGKTENTREVEQSDTTAIVTQSGSLEDYAVIWESGMEFTSTGNVLVAMAPKKKMRYIYWNESQYKWLGELPELEIECSTYSKHAGVYRHSITKDGMKMARMNMYEQGGDDAAIRTLDGTTINIETMTGDGAGRTEYTDTSLHYPYQKDDTTHNIIVSAWADVIAKAASHNTFLFPYFVRYAIRLFDDTIAWASAPILMQPTNGAPVCWNHRVDGYTIIDGKENEKEWICFMVATNDESFLNDKADASSSKAETNLNLKVLTDINLTTWKDVIKSIDIYVSKPLTLFDVEGYYRTMKRPEIVFNHPEVKYDEETYHASWLTDQLNELTNLQWKKINDEEVKPVETTTVNENDLWSDDTRTVIKSKWFEEQYRCDHISGDVFTHTSAEPLSYMRAENVKPFSGDESVCGVFSSELEWMHALAHSHEGYTYEEGELKEGTEDERRKKLYFGLRQMCLIKPNGLESEDVKDKIEEGMNMQYLLKSFSLSELETEGVSGTIKLSQIEGLVKVTRGYLSNLEQKDYIDSSVNSDTWLIGGKVYKYNGRVNIFDTEEAYDVKRRAYAMLQDIKREHKCKIMTIWTNEGGSYGKIQIKRRPIFYFSDDDEATNTTSYYPIPDDWCKSAGNDFRHVQSTESDTFGHPKTMTEGTFAAYVLIKEAGVSYVVKIGEDWSKGYVQGRMPAFICWPNRNASKIIVYRGNQSSCERYVYPLRKHATADLAYWSEYTDEDVEPEEGKYTETEYEEKNKDYDDGIAKGVTTKRPNYIYTSGADNPFVFDWAGVNRVGNGRIKAVAIQRAAISQGQFGTSPLIVMCTDGNFAMSVSQSKTQTGVEEGLFYAVNPMISDVLNGEDVAMMEDSILYVSNNGVMMLSGNQSVSLSEQLDGMDKSDTVTFSQWAADAIPLYEYNNKRILIVKKGDTLCFVMDLGSKAWTTMTLPGEVVSVIQEYPYPILQVRDGDDGTVKVITLDKVDGYDSSDTASCTIETRPMRLESTHLKKLNQMAIQARATSTVTTTLMGSNDLENWQVVGTTTNRRVPRIGGRLYKYWKLKMEIQNMKANEDVTGVTLEWTEREGNVIR